MEHRLSRRVSSGRHVVVYIHGKPVSFAVADNINATGAFLRLSGRRFPKNTSVSLRLHDRGAGWRHPNSPPIKGVVVHQTEAGIGVMFTRDTAALLAAAPRKRPTHTARA